MGKTSRLRRIRPRHARVVVLASAAALAIFAYLLRPDPPPPRPLTIDYVVSTDALEVLTPLVKEFNDEHMRSDGNVIRVELSSAASGKAAAEIGKSMRPVIWTPASSAWTRFVGRDSFRVGGSSLFQSPEVVAVWDSEAERLNLTDSIGFARLTELVTSNELQFGHTDPRKSTSGLFALLSEFGYYAGKPPGELALEDVSAESAREGVRRFESSNVHYLDIAKDFSDEWCQDASAFASAAYMQETTFTTFQKKCGPQLREVFVTDFPFVANYPYIVLRGSWVSEDEGSAADVFGAWLEERLRNDKDLGKSGFRDGKEIHPELATGIDPDQPASPPPSLPGVDVLRAIQHSWTELRRPANVMLVVDESRGMAPAGREAPAEEALLAFLACPGAGRAADDRVGMITFGGDGAPLPESRVPIADFDQNRIELGQEIDSLAARGESHLWDAVDAALDTPELHDGGPLRTIILLTHGADDGSATTPEQLKAKLSASVDDRKPVQVLVVPYGASESDRALLQDYLVTPSNGRTFKKDTADVGEVKNFMCEYE